ncbi:MAG TPA: hypothetical protein VGP93_02305, partial [Polyangiaceae bacterium]|nr:hypothetical protein [Polyangiaceae bacterium]
MQRRLLKSWLLLGVLGCSSTPDAETSAAAGAGGMTTAGSSNMTAGNGGTSVGGSAGSSSSGSSSIAGTAGSSMGGSVAGGGTGGTTDTGSGGEAGGGGASVIFDTDMGPDIDDAGALAVLHALADNAEVTLLAVGISTSRGTGSPAIGFIDQVDTYYSRPDIPIGIWKGGDFHGPDSNNYTQKIYDQSDKFPRSLDDSQDSVPEAFALYRQILAGEPDGSVTIVCTGFMNNMKALLESGPDENSDLDGTALVAAKVKELVQMG